MGDLDLILEAISALNDACFTDDAWAPALACICRILGSSGVTVALEDRNMTFPVVHFAGVPPESVEAYATEFQKLDPVIAHSRSAPIGVAYPDWMATDRDRLVRSRFTRDFASRFDMGHCMQAYTDRNSLFSGFFAVARPDRSGAYTEHDRDRAHALLPYLRHVLQVRRHIHVLETQRLAALDALDTLSHCAFLVDGDLTVIFANAEGERLLTAATGLATRRRRLVAARDVDTRKLHRLVGQVVGGGIEAEPQPIVLARSSSIRPLIVRAVPFSARTADGLCGARASVFLLVIDPDRRPVSVSAPSRLAFGFTPTEARVSELLVQGDDPAAIARLMGVSISTVRTHLSRLFAKTGARRQADLVGLLQLCNSRAKHD